MSTFGSRVLAIFYIYLALSIDPISAARIKVTREATNTVHEHMELMRELEKAMQENHMDQLFEQNATSQYIGESWATCAQRKEDFKRRSLKVQERYAKAQEDGTIGTAEFGWVVLKARKVALTVSMAAKQGCEWVHEQKMDPEAIVPLQKIQNETIQKVPCYNEAVAYITSKTEPTDEDGRKAMSILFSKDCKAKDLGKEKDLSLEESIAAEEKEEAASAEVAKEFVKEHKGADEDPMSALLQRASSHASTESADALVIYVGGILGLIIGLLITTLTCIVALALYALVLMAVWCLFRAILALLLNLLGSYSFNDNFGACADRWISWGTGHGNQVGQLGAALCFVTTLLGQPIAHFGYHNGVWVGGHWYVR
jgi:hypothetical protein